CTLHFSPATFLYNASHVCLCDICLYFFMSSQPPRPTLFPYTTLFRSQDPSLSIPAGFPKGTSGDLAHATNKIIAVRSYVQSLALDRKSTRLNSSHVASSYAVFCLKKKIEASKVSLVITYPSIRYPCYA